MIRLIMAISVICVALTMAGISYCYIKGIDPAIIDRESEAQDD